MLCVWSWQDLPCSIHKHSLTRLLMRRPPSSTYANQCDAVLPVPVLDKSCRVGGYGLASIMQVVGELLSQHIMKDYSKFVAGIDSVSAIETELATLVALAQASPCL